MSKSLDLAGYELTVIAEALARKLLANAADQLKQMKKETPEAFEGCGELTAEDVRTFAQEFFATAAAEFLSDVEASLKTETVSL